ncbi:MAG: glutamyl-tRNA reductase [Candidatus Omnitrophica bacterium]|nr:glutamyl-tRNA reductase [Candidatus Omnitrophota bacterium]
MNHIVLVGLNHRCAPIELRERLSFRREQLSEAFSRLRTEAGLEESVILSTCNRVEIYASVAELDGTFDRLHRFLSGHGGVDLLDLRARLYSYTQPHSVRHAFMVASGLDSMVVGEHEILHQVKQAYEWAQEHQATGKTLNALFQKALNAAKDVRTQTGIGCGCSSIGTAAVALSEKIFGSLADQTVLLVGVGKIGERTVKSLAGRGVRQIRVMSRSLPRAVTAASLYAATPLSLEALNAQLREADIVITATSAPTHVLGLQDVAEAMSHRPKRPLCLIDLGVPRNVDPSVAALENVHLFDVDDLQGLVNGYAAQRQGAVLEGERIIEQKVGHFLKCNVPLSSALVEVP